MYIEQLAIVLLCTIIQNLFGVGILVFGTPILLGLGYDYLQVLGVLCPASLAVSMVQILTIKDAKVPEKKMLLQSGMGVIIGVGLLSVFVVPTFIYAVTAVTMFLAGALRLNKSFQKKVHGFLTMPKLHFYFANGVFHGFSNLGGILLVLKHNLDAAHKNQSLMHTACVYLVYVVLQIFVLCLSGNADLFLHGVLISPFVVLFSVVFGRKPLASFSQKHMDLALGVFFVSAGAVLSYKIAH